VHHAAQLDLVEAVAVDAEKADEPALADPLQVVDLIVGTAPECSPFELEPAAVVLDAGGSEQLDPAELLGL
jgi:hypothetical protein